MPLSFSRIIIIIIIIIIIMIMKYFVLFFLSIISVNSSTTNERHIQLCNGHREPSCFGPSILNENNGRIISHPLFNMTMYSSNTSCTWIIRAPQNNVINVQFTFLSLENSEDCHNDYVTFYNGYSTIKSQQIQKVCGTNISNKIKSSINVMLVHFVTNSDINGLGFQLRYTFSKNPNESTGTKQISDTATPVTCGTLETRCETSRECISRDWQCDGIRDCEDNSDEIRCERKTCATSTIRCSADCIPNEQFCGNISQCQEIAEKVVPPESATAPHPGTRASCSNQPIPNTEMKIVGGMIARQGSWPWQLSLRSSEGILCGGSIISSQWIVTAAHCVQGRTQPSSWTIQAGRFTLYGNENTAQNFRAARVIQHPNYDYQTNDNDIALMKISGQLRLNNYVQPVCIGSSIPPAGTKCYITGWGVTQGTGGDGYLKQAVVPIVDHDLCNEWYGDFLTNNMLCAGYERGGVDACQGDSGGPLVCKVNEKFQLIGITSWGGGCAQPRQPGVYTAASNFANWISNIINNNN